MSRSTPRPHDAPLSRREFVALAAATAAASAVAATPGVAAAASASASPRSLRYAAFDVEERSIGEWQAALARGELTSRQLVERYLQRIESLDATGPTLRAVLETNPDALDIATTLDAERRNHR